MTQQSVSLLQDTEQIPGISQVYFAAYHRPPGSGLPDSVSQYIQDFRKWVEPQTSRWISLVAPLICNAGPFDIIVRALGSSELTAQVNGSLDRLCEVIAQQSGATYSPELLVKKRPTRTLQGLGGRTGHRKELAGVYEFRGAGIKADSRILVVDDIMSTGSTLEAIGAAIKNALPDPEVVGFVLGKAGTASNAHIDAECFVTTQEGSMAERKATTKATSLPPRKSPRKRPPAQKNRIGQAPVKPPVPAPAPARKRKPAVMMYVISIVLAFVILGAIVPLRSGKNTPRPDTAALESLPPPPEPVEQGAPPPVAPAKDLRPPEVRKNLHPAVVTIPNVGLRTYHSLESRKVPRAAIRNGERVEIIGRYANGGPGWLQVRTRAGKVGWVFASVVKEQKG